MKKVFYEKVGRKYVPVREYDSDLMDALPKGTHIIMCYPGGQSTRYNIDPAHAPMIAAARVAEDAICRAISKAAELRPKQTAITPGQKAAWENLAREFGDELSTLHGLSIRDCAEAGVEAMISEAERIMSNENVRKAYDEFLLLCKLTASKQNG